MFSLRSCRSLSVNILIFWQQLRCGVFREGVFQKMPALKGQFLKEISVRFAGENHLRTQKNTKQSSAQRFLNDPFPKTPSFSAADFGGCFRDSFGPTKQGSKKFGDVLGAWEKLNRGVSKPGGFALFSGKVQIVSRTLSGLLLVGALNRPRRRKRTNRENPRTIPEQIGKIPEKSGKSQKGQKRTKRKDKSGSGNPPRLKPPRLAALDFGAFFVENSWLEEKLSCKLRSADAPP